MAFGKNEAIVILRAILYGENEVFVIFSDYEIFDGAGIFKEL
jgi:hypothetical protein